MLDTPSSIENEAYSSVCATTAEPRGYGIDVRATHWPGRRSPTPKMSGACRRSSSASMSATRCCDEGINFYRFLMQNACGGRCRGDGHHSRYRKSSFYVAPTLADTASDIALARS